MEEKTILPGYKHYLADIAIGSNLAEHVRAADLLMAKPAWLGFWTPSSTVRFLINDVVKTPLTVVKSGVPVQDVPIGVVWRDRDREIEIQLPGNLLQVPFFMGLGSPHQICLIALAHESFHCAQMDRQTRMNVPTDQSGSPFSQAIHPKLPAEALSLCVALFRAYPDAQGCASIAAVKRLGDSALEGQADLVGLVAILKPIRATLRSSEIGLCSPAEMPMRSTHRNTTTRTLWRPSAHTCQARWKRWRYPHGDGSRRRST